MHVTPLDRTALLRGRVAVYLLFLLSGMAIGTWTAGVRGCCCWGFWPSAA